MKLLSMQHTNAKMAKNGGQGYLSAILHLAPSNLSGYNVCPKATQGCKAVCLNFSGRGRFTNVQQARLRKTKLFIESRAEFLKLLDTDIQALCRKANREGLKPAIRLNGTSDLNWLPTILRYPDVQFYDYTKVLTRLTQLRERQDLFNQARNYHLTFSLSETNLHEAMQAIRLGFNVAAVYSKELPAQDLGCIVIDGTSHDLRFNDKRGVVVGLLANGLAKKDISGFVRTLKPALKLA